MSDKETKNFEIPYAVEAPNTVYVPIPAYDFNRAKKFYSEIMDFPITWDGGEEIGWTEFQLPGKSTRMGIFPVTGKLKEQGINEFDQTHARINFSVGNLDKTKEILDKRGVETQEIQDIPNMISILTAKDSEGNILSFIGEPRIKNQ